MFDIRSIPGGVFMDGKFTGLCWEVFQRFPRKTELFECSLDELQAMIEQHFPQLKTPIGHLAVATAVADLRLSPWWSSAGPITEETRYLLREGFKNLSRVLSKGINRVGT